MKIGFDAKWFFEGPPSGKLVVQNLLKQLIEQNYKNDIYIILDKRNINTPFPFQGSNIKLIYIWAGNNLISNLFYLPIALFRYKLDVVIVQNFTPIISNFKSFVYIYDILFASHPNFFSLKERIYFSPIKYLNKFAHQIITISFSEKERIVKYKYGKRENIEVIHCAVSEILENYDYSELKEMYVREKYKLPTEFILYVGRLNIRKNIKNLILAFSKYSNENNQICLVLVGKEDESQTNIKNVIKQNNLQDKIILTGFVEDRDLPIIYSMAKLFCFISFAEGFGIPLLESMACGTPVIASDIPVHKEVGSVAVVYVDPNNVLAIANSIRLLLTDDKLYKKMMKAGFLRVKEFTWKDSTSKLLKILESIN